jgi:hypothetical protein
MKPIKTYLPLFSGFYGTLFEPDTSWFEHENECTYDDYNFDNSQYELDVVKECINFVAENCEFIKSIKFESIVSPKTYNFSNDSANVSIELDRVGFKRYLNDNSEALDNYLKDRYTSCSGFWSSYGNSVDLWKEETSNFKMLDGHYLGSLLNFYFLNESIEEYDMYSYVSESVHAESYCEMKEVDDKEVLKERVESGEIDLNFGYNAILLKEAQYKVELFGGDVYDYLIETIQQN